MKKVLLVAVMALGISQVNAQNYKNALGVVVDLGDGETLVGPQFKHSFDGKNAGNVQVMFGDHITVLGADYTYNQPIGGTNPIYAHSSEIMLSVQGPIIQIYPHKTSGSVFNTLVWITA